MYANYHTHTYLCGHASKDTPEEYVEKAISNGLKILGFSDHSPYIFSEEHISPFRISLKDTEKYVCEIESLKQKYRNNIEIMLGYEMEYYPKEFEKTINFIKQYPCDYLILGQHFTNNEYDGIYSGTVSTVKTLKTYVNQVIEGINTGVFSCVAHPDLIFYRENLDIYIEEMTKLCIEAKKHNIPFEFNLLGFDEGRAYPFSEFWKIVSQVGNEVIIGSDAHKKERVCKLEIYNKAKRYLSEHDIVPIEKLDIKKV